MRPGQMLIATPLLEDPNFRRTVVYVFAMDDGAAGVILNRPSDIPVGAILGEWADAAAPPGMVHLGGPVAVEHAVALGLGDHEEMITARVGLVDLDGAPDAVEEGSLRVFAGYAGWGPGQLEQEIEDSAWFLVDGWDAAIIDPDPATLWRRALRRERAELRRFADYPDDPTLN